MKTIATIISTLLLSLSLAGQSVVTVSSGETYIDSQGNQFKSDSDGFDGELSVSGTVTEDEDQPGLFRVDGMIEDATIYAGNGESNGVTTTLVGDGSSAEAGDGTIIVITGDGCSVQAKGAAVTIDVNGSGSTIVCENGSSGTISLNGNSAGISISSGAGNWFIF